MRYLLLFLLVLGAVPVLAQTDPTPADPTTQTPFALPSPSPTADSITLHFWLPDALAGLDNVDAGDVLAEQIGGFQAAHPAILIDLRLRAAEGAGGLLESLRATSAVAPAALPDITLLRYADFLAAAQEDLLAALDPAELPPFDALYAPSVAAMAQVDGTVYGVPSTLDLLHVSAPVDAALPPAWRFDALLEAGIPLLFPAAPPDGIADVFLLQYLEAGAAARSEGGLGLDEAALRTTLRFYERAVAQELIPIDALEYDIPDRYAGAMGDPMPLVVRSHMVLQALRGGTALAYGTVPTADGAPVTLGDGWLWVITTEDGGRSAAALRFLTWMLATERQAAYHRVIDHLPAASAAQRQVDADYAAFVAPLLENMLLLPASYRQGALAQALQNAYAAVISGQSSANDALAAVLAQMGQ